MILLVNTDFRLTSTMKIIVGKQNHCKLNMHVEKFVNLASSSASEASTSSASSTSGGHEVEVDPVPSMFTPRGSSKPTRDADVVGLEHVYHRMQGWIATRGRLLRKQQQDASSGVSMWHQYAKLRQAEEALLASWGACGQHAGAGAGAASESDSIFSDRRTGFLDGRVATRAAYVDLEEMLPRLELSGKE